MHSPTWQETQQYLGMPAAQTVEQSIILAQLEILRRVKNCGPTRDKALRRFVAIAEGREADNA